MQREGRQDEDGARRVRFEVSDELVARVRLGDEAAFEQMVRVAFPALWGFALGFSGSSEEAEDLVQDVFCGVWRMGVDWHPAGSARSYLFASVRNAALNGRRRQEIEARIHQQTVEEGGPERTLVDGPDVGLEGDDRLEDVWREVATLPERQRTAFQLRYEQELSVAEVGHVLGTTAKGAERLLGRAVQEVRKRLGTGGDSGRGGRPGMERVPVAEGEVEGQRDGDPAKARVTRTA